MRFQQPLIEGRLVKRYKRFLADVSTDNGGMTVHCPNSGSMAGLTQPGNAVRISGPHGEHRKYRYTLEQVQIKRPDGRRIWVGVNTGVPNILAREIFEKKLLSGFEQYSTVKSEVKLHDHSRIDIQLLEESLPSCWVEVKNVTLVQSDPWDKLTVNHGSIATFPDAVTSRGVKHLQDLMNCVNHGERAAMLFIIQRSDTDRFSTSPGFDTLYAETFKEALQNGVEAYAMQVRVTRQGIWPGKLLPIL